MASTLRVAVVGVGHLGRYHAQKYAALPGCELVGLVDANPERLAQVSAEVGAPGHARLEDVLPLVDALSIATPTQTHHAVGMACLTAGKHVLIEKPIASTSAQGRELVQAAAQAGRVLQVGYLQRYNPAMVACRTRLGTPQFIESVRIAPFVERGADVDVVLDLMSHDLDLVLSMIDAPLQGLHAVGVSILTPSTDLANARLIFANGSVANLTASRISAKAERKMRIFQQGGYFSLDFVEPSVKAYSQGKDDSTRPVLEEMAVSKGDELQSEIEAFLHAVRTGEAPPAGGAEGLAVLELAERVIGDIQRNTLP